MSPSRALSAAFEIARITPSGALSKTDRTNSESLATEINLIVRFTTLLWYLRVFLVNLIINNKNCTLRACRNDLYRPFNKSSQLFVQ